MVFYLLTKYEKKAAAFIGGLAILLAIYQAEVTAQLFYTDYLRFQADKRLAFDLDARVSRVTGQNGNIALAMVGTYRPAKYANNFLYGDIIGYSMFEWDSNARAIPFMRVLGLNYLRPRAEQMETVRSIAETMPSYPADDCVKRFNEEIVIIKLSPYQAEEEYNPTNLAI
jgi:hypothetical protein